MLRLFIDQLASDVPADASEPLRSRMKAFECVFLVLLVAASAKLWHKPVEEYPQVPLVELGMRIPESFGTLGIIGLLVSSCIAASSRASLRRFGAFSFCLCAGALVASDQHRLQPWLYQLVLLNCFTLLLSDRWYLVASRLLLVSIYLFSAVSKLDHVFLQTLGQQFAAQFGDFVGFELEGLNSGSRMYVASFFPVCELLLGIGLWLRWTRKLAGYLAVAMHVALVAILGPVGLDHHLAVLVWNAFFIVQVWLLFVRQSHTPIGEHNEHWLRIGLPEFACCVLVLLPLLEPFGMMDHWPAWQLYAPRNSRVTCSVLENRVDHLPEEIRQHLVEDRESFSPWQRLDIDAWSLQSVGVPIYPQARFQLGVCLNVAERFDLGGGIRVELHSPADRWTGKRETQTLRGVEEVAEASRNAFRLNAIPRPLEKP